MGQPESSPPPGVHLTRTDENLDEIEALTRRFEEHGGRRVGVRGVVDELATGAGTGARRMWRSWAPGLKVRRALRFPAPDQTDPAWWPQGIATSAHTDVDRPVLLVSWYAKDWRGSRITVLDLGTRRYRHVWLVEPTVVSEDGDTRVEMRPVKVHAGGLVWQAPYLHVAATARGFLTFHLEDLLEVPDGLLHESHGQRHVLPVRFAYRAAAEQGVEKLRYSFLALDRTAEEPALLVGEYGRGKQTTRLAAFAVDAASGLLHADPQGVSRPRQLSEAGQRQMQGVAVVDGRHYVTVSRGPWVPGSVYVGRPGQLRRRRWAAPMGPEDLTYLPQQGLLWSVTEHPGRRWVFAMRPASLR